MTSKEIKNFERLDSMKIGVPVVKNNGWGYALKGILGMKRDLTTQGGITLQ
jgi:hypothetical protein